MARPGKARSRHGGEAGMSLARAWAMNRWLEPVTPRVTDAIRVDHAQMLALYRHFRGSASARKKRALVETTCIALEIHTRLEEELFYPVLREAAPDVFTAEKSLPEHDEMRRLVTRLRALPPEDADYDMTFVELMRDVMHHVADEETTLLPAAERLLPQRLKPLGAEMTRRRAALLAPRSAELAMLAFRSLPESAFVAAATGGAALGCLFDARVGR
jgi:hypothetical protein